MKPSIFIGVDGGATKTHVRIENQDGKLLAEAQGGHACIRISVPESWATILATTNKALEQAGLNLQDNNFQFHAGMGLSGSEIAKAYQQFIATPHQFSTLILKSDAVTACIGAHAGKDGDIIIIGTGTVGIQHYANSEIQVGGWGFPHDDLGSGSWLGVKASGLALQWYDGRVIKESSLLNAVLSHFDNEPMQIVAWGNAARSTQFAELAPLVTAHAKMGDWLAIELLQQAAAEIDRISAALTARSKCTTVLPCALIGSLAPFLEPYLSQQLRARLVPKQFDPAKGAILMLRKNLRE